MRPPPLACLPEEPFLLALSGGCDSVALLMALLEVGRPPAVVAHYNHRWHPREDEVARVCRQKVRGLGVPFVLGRSARAGGAGGEGEAREERYAFLLAVARRRKLGAVLTAHSMEDQAETVLMRLGRGCGLRGLGGMRPVVEREGAVLVRPWIHVRRASIRAWAEGRNLAWDEDPFNREEQFARVAVRQRVIPALSQALARDVVPALARLADIASGEDGWMQRMAEEALEQARDVTRRERLVVRVVAGWHEALARRVLAAWLQGSGVGGVGWKEVEAVRGLLVPGAGACVNLPGNCRARRTAGRLWVDKF